MPQDAQWALQLALYEATLLPTLSSESEPEHRDMGASFRFSF